MKALIWTIVAIAGLSGISVAQSISKPEGSSSVREKLIGAWHLVSMEDQGEDGKVNRNTDVTGVLIYTRDGHMSVQLMFPESAAGLSNDYVKNGYEASFGSYEINEAAKTVTHHVQGSVTRGLVGKDLPRLVEFSGGH